MIDRKTNRITHITLYRKIACIGIVLSCLVAAAIPVAFATEPMRILYPGTARATDKRADYYLKLLDLVFSKTGVRYELRPNLVLMAPYRALRQMDDNEGITVFWGPTTREMEQRCLPIRIPIDKGILGWRLFLIKARDRALFANIHSLKQLQAFYAGQQRDWADTYILRDNGLKVVGTTTYDSMFQMLAADRFQYFPRGIGEVWNEASSNAGLGLEVEQHLALHYPAYTYFFVGKNNTALAQLIEKGLRAAMRDGSFDKLFEQYNGDSIRRARLNTRMVFELGNPLLPDDAASRQRDDFIRR